jgi:hypothetical protein
MLRLFGRRCFAFQRPGLSVTGVSTPVSLGLVGVTVKWKLPLLLVVLVSLCGCLLKSQEAHVPHTGKQGYRRLENTHVRQLAASISASNVKRVTIEFIKSTYELKRLTTPKVLVLTSGRAINELLEAFRKSSRLPGLKEPPERGIATPSDEITFEMRRGQSISFPILGPSWGDPTSDAWGPEVAKLFLRYRKQVLGK